MAGHSKFKNIMHRKGGQDAKRAQAFTKLAREITIAAKMGLPDPDSNARLRAAISAARAQSMPKDNIQRAIDKAVSGGDADNLVELRYEGYGPGNVAVIVECLTDNKNRTAAEVRTAFNKNGGAMGETGSVAFNFDRIGLIHYPPAVGDSEKVLEAAIEAGADDVESSEDGHDIYCQPDDLASVTKALESGLGEPEASRLDWRPKMTVAVDGDTTPLLMKFLSALDDSDDVQRVAANYEIDDAVMESLEG